MTLEQRVKKLEVALKRLLDLLEKKETEEQRLWQKAGEFNKRILEGQQGLSKILSKMLEIVEAEK